MKPRIIPLEEGLAANLNSHRKMNVANVYETALQSAFADSFNDARLDKNISVLEAYSTIYQKVTSSQLKMVALVDLVRTFYLVDVCLDQVTADALSPEIGTDEIIEIKYKDDEKIEKELQRLEKRLNLDQFLVNITPDLCAYGEYTVKTDIDYVESEDGERKSKGLLALRDIVEQGTVVSLTQDSEQMGYLGLDELGRICRYENADFVKFTLGGNRIRVRLEDQIPYIKNEKLQKFLEKLPRYVRVGKSMIYKLIPKFKELELLEKLVPASKLSKLANVNLVGMNVPSTYDIDKAMQASKKLEGVINNKVGVDNKIGELTVEAVLSVAGRTKIIPIFGDKGNLSKLDYKIEEADDLAGSVNETRQTILDSIGIPYELIYKSDGESKGSTLKRYARYLRHLKNVQRALSEGVRQICSIHLANIGVEFDPDKIEIEFKNKLVEIDNLDKLEHADVTISFINNAIDFFNKLSEPESMFKDNLDLNAAAEWVNNQLKTIGLHGLIKVKSEGGSDIVKPSSTDNVDTPTEEPSEPTTEPDTTFDGTMGTEPPSI